MYSFIKHNVKFYKINFVWPFSGTTFAKDNTKFFVMTLPDSKNFYQALGERIKTERIKKKITQKSLGDYLELSRASIINLETGRHHPSIYQLMKIANFLKKDYTFFLPVDLSKPKRKQKQISADLKNIISDQDKIERSTRVMINNFLSEIKT